MEKDIDDTKPMVYLSEQVEYQFSGLFSTVEEELLLHSVNQSGSHEVLVKNIIGKYDFGKLVEINPYQLSGGQKVRLALMSAILFEPNSLLLDSCLEQLDEYWREFFLNEIEQNKLPIAEVFISDNRLDEYADLADAKRVVFPAASGAYSHPFLPPDIQNIDFKNLFSKIGSNLEIRSLDFSYNKRSRVFENFNVQLNCGEIYHMKGRNGAGKSTLAKILSGVLKINSGEILKDGKPYNPYKYPGEEVGYCFQNPDEQLFERIVEEEILRVKGNSILDSRRDQILQAFGLEKIKGFHPGDMPFVIRKRISIASTLAKDRSWYIFDEPTLGQDDKFTTFLIELFRKVTEAGKGIIVISHSSNFIYKLKSKNINIT